ncbi:MAG: DUF3106 domain-containing protein [Gammaproteobacteria bacterium]|nr:MAG: DUF3106 domain-containing protein [Gammaproteobacteria bacterium]
MVSWESAVQAGDGAALLRICDPMRPPHPSWRRALWLPWAPKSGRRLPGPAWRGCCCWCRRLRGPRRPCPFPMRNCWSSSPTGRARRPGSTSGSRRPFPARRPGRRWAWRRVRRRDGMKLGSIGVRWILLACLWLAGSTAWADAPDWDALTAEQQRILRPFASRWDALPESRRQRLLDAAERWKRMSPRERKRLRERFRKWKRLSPRERARLRKRWLRFQSLPPEVRRRLRERYRAFRRLPPAKRRALRERWRRMTPEERRRWLHRRFLLPPRPGQGAVHEEAPADDS